MEIAYNLFVQPIIFIIDIVFVVLYHIIQDLPLVLIFLSIIVNLITTPLYLSADRIQQEQRLKEEKMRPFVHHIRSAFSGDERFMMLSAYYRVENYHPVSVLKESLPLLLQIPIFMAAYRYLCAAPILSGSAFGPIIDLGAPDHLLHVGNIRINILPIVMTMFNLLSGYVYTKRSSSFRQKVQIIGLALVFLVLLYASPSGLVLYWTTSQVYSLVRNLKSQTKIFEKEATAVSLSILGIALPAVLTVLRLLDSPVKVFMGECVLFISLLNIVRYLFRHYNIQIPLIKNKVIKLIDQLLPEENYPSYFIIALCTSLLFGICLPASVLASSAGEFVETSSGRFLTQLLVYPAEVYCGLFVVWGSIFYYFSKKKGRKILFISLSVWLALALLNHFCFDVKPAFFYVDLSFDGELSISASDVTLNIIISALVVAALLWLRKKHWLLVSRIAVVLAISLAILGSIQVLQIPFALKEKSDEATPIITENGDSDIIHALSLSKVNKNVLIIMLDRALGSYVPYIFDEKPELLKSFSGFVYYPNTISFGGATSQGAPPLYGGYDYTTESMTARMEQGKGVRTSDGFLVLPSLFSQNGYKTTVADPAWYGIGIYCDCQDVTAINLVGRVHGSQTYEGNIIPVQKRNFVMYSLFKTAPLFLRNQIYDNGGYVSISTAQTELTQAFIDNYSELEALPSLITASDSEQGSFLFLQNATTHEPTVLEAPDYEVKVRDFGASNYIIPYGNKTVDGRTLEIQSYSAYKHYCVNMVSYMRLAELFDSMREQGTYDNTRIILVSDHGFGSNPAQFPEWIFDDGTDLAKFNCLLMVKDFQSSGSMTTNMEFMTNADTPTLAIKDIIENAVNPYTSNPITSNRKEERPILIAHRAERWRDNADDHLTFDEYEWLSVHDNIFDINNWSILGEGGRE